MCIRDRLKSRRRRTGSGWRIRLDAEPEADTPDGLDESGVAQLLAQRCDMNVEGLGGAVPMWIPHRLEDVRATEDRTRVLGQEREEVVLLRGERDLLAVDLSLIH